MAESGFAPVQGSSFVETVAGTTSALAVTPANTITLPGSATAKSTTATNTRHDRKGIVAGTPTLSKAETVFCGSTAGVVSRFVIAPLDVVKIRLQLQTQRKDLPNVLRRKEGSQGLSIDVKQRMDTSAANASRTTTTLQPKYRGMFSGIATIAREEGIRGLWKGNMAAEYLYLTYGGMQFLIYQQTKSFLSRTADLSAQQARTLYLTGGSAYVAHVFMAVTGSSAVQSFISGATAGIMATACTYPFDLLRTRFAIQRDVKVYTGVPQAFGHIFRRDGIRGFYRGMTPALIQVIPYMGIMFGSYDSLKQLASWLKARANTESSIPTSVTSPASKMTFSSTSDPPPMLKTVGQFLLGLEDMLCGAMAGLISKTAIYPLDMVRKRLQIQGSEQQMVNLGVYTSTSTSTAAVKSSMEALPTNVWSCMTHIVRREGYLALYKGLLPGLLKAAPASAVTFFVFSQTGAIVEHVRRPQQENP
ncbi:mitochondrial thiamine pyrophosphate transporter [Mortierella sp. GBA30]|nr:mitochondrial thiamine pyrophosphate transporter [Mortierella sp. GBA30]